MFGIGKKSRAQELIAQGISRRIRIHSVVDVPEDDPNPTHLRVAFEFLDPPGPWSMQFYECSRNQPDITSKLEPGANALFYESEDGARTRVLTLEDGTPLWPR